MRAGRVYWVLVATIYEIHYEKGGIGSNTPIITVSPCVDVRGG